MRLEIRIKRSFELKKRRIIDFCIVAGTLSIIIALLIFFSFLGIRYLDNLKITVFSDIEECQLIEKAGNDEDATVIKISNPSNDKLYDEKFAYKEFWAIQYTSSECSFEIYAYEFENEDIAKAYFEEFVSNGGSKDSSFHSISGINYGQQTVYQNERAYTIYASSHKNLKEAVALVNNCFSVELISPKNSETNVQ